MSPWQHLHPDPLRQSAALLLVLAWLVLLAATLWRQRRHTRPRLQATDAPANAHPALLIAFASQSGFAAQLAQQHARQLSAQGWQPQCLPLGQVQADTLQGVRHALFLISTTGEGDAPDNAAAFIRRCMAAPDAAIGLPHLHYRLLALGDSRYARYCGFGRAVDDWLQRSGAHPDAPRMELDNAHPDALAQWQACIDQLMAPGHTASTATATPVQAATPQPWRLAQRQILNPGSPGAPLARLVLEPLHSLPHWQAGDVATLEIPSADRAAPSLWRDYTIASLPASGHLELLVRQQLRSDGSPGIGSHWLLHQLQPGQTLHLNLRHNPLFHPPAIDKPLILIGSGTGLAGLLAQIRHRAAYHAQGQTIGPLWLLYGERSPRHDAHFDACLHHWRQQGVLHRLERAYSRDPDAPPHLARHVQELLPPLAQPLQKLLLHQQASLYLCGSRQPMAQGVHATLEALLGTDTLQTLTETGRYLRDVY